LFAWYGVLELPFFGWDAYPLIASARVDGAGDAAALVTRELMDGRYPLGHFYRPLVQLSIALDHALWGVEAFGYHLTDLALWTLTALATMQLARTLFGARAHAGAAVAGLFFALHPLGWDVLPAPARRADVMALLFGTAALACVPASAARARRAAARGSSPRSRCSPAARRRAACWSRRWSPSSPRSQVPPAERGSGRGRGWRSPGPRSRRPRPTSPRARR
jgi:hypothetical protein